VLADVARANLTPGRTLRLDDGTQITFDGYRQWATLQVSRDLGQPVLLGAGAAVVLGLLLSLTIRRRRIWLRITPAADSGTTGRTVIAVGGLARTDASSFNSEFLRLVGRLAPDPPGDGRKD
jgi:cytochrome c biogenesis protein